MVESDMGKVVEEIRTAVNKLTVEMTELKVDIRHLVSDSLSTDAFKERIIKLEVRLDTIERFRIEQSATNKWLIALVTGMVMAVIGMIFTHRG